MVEAHQQRKSQGPCGIYLLFRPREFFALLNLTFAQWSEDNALRMGAALAYYTLFALAPLLVIAIAIAGVVFGAQAVQGQVTGQIRGLVGEDSANAIQTMIESAHRPTRSAIAAVIGAFALTPVAFAQSTPTPTNKVDCEKAKMKWEEKGGKDGKGTCIAAPAAAKDAVSTKQPQISFLAYWRPQCIRGDGVGGIVLSYGSCRQAFDSEVDLTDFEAGGVETELEIELGQFLELLGEQPVVPNPRLREPVVGDHKGPLLGLVEMFQADSRDVRVA